MADQTTTTTTTQAPVNAQTMPNGSLTVPYAVVTFIAWIWNKAMPFYGYPTPPLDQEISGAIQIALTAIYFHVARSEKKPRVAKAKKVVTTTPAPTPEPEAVKT